MVENTDNFGLKATKSTMLFARDPQPLTLLPSTAAPDLFGTTSLFKIATSSLFNTRLPSTTIVPSCSRSVNSYGKLPVLTAVEARCHGRIRRERSFTMNTSSDVTIQVLVFSLVAAAFTTVYITQPVLPVIQDEFAVDARTASLSISMVILGIALANLPFGILADRYPIKPILLTGGTVITATSLVCAATHSIAILIAARFIQGLFIPSLTTCLAAYLAKSLPASRLNVVMGSYVSATVAGGMGGRLLGGWIHPPLHWRYAFVSASVLLITATIAASSLAARRERGAQDLNCSRPASSSCSRSRSGLKNVGYSSD